MTDCLFGVSSSCFDGFPSRCQAWIILIHMAKDNMERGMAVLNGKAVGLLQVKFFPILIRSRNLKFVIINKFNSEHTKLLTSLPPTSEQNFKLLQNCKAKVKVLLSNF